MVVKQTDRKVEAVANPASPKIRVTDLPSKFLPYPTGVVEYVPYTFGELVRLAQSNLDPVGITKFILEGIKTSFNKEDLSYFDFMYVALLRRISSAESNQFSFMGTCGDCGDKRKYISGLADLEFNDLTVPDLPIIIEVGGFPLHFMPLTVGKYMELSESGKLDDRVEVYASTVVNKPKDQVRMILESAPGTIVEDIEEVDRLLMFGVKTLPIKCGACGESIVVDIEDPEVLVRPFRPDENPPRNRILFGVKGHS